MDILSKEEFIGLANYQGKNCISIFIPTHSSGNEVNERYDVIVFKNNLQAVKADLTAKEVDSREIDAMLKPGFELLKDDEFWNNQLEGLAAFFSEGFFNIIKIPFKVKEERILNSRFYLSPLLPLISKRHRFYLLVLSKNDAKLYEGDQFEMKKLEVEGLPDGMNDVIAFEQKDKRQLFRKGGTAPGADASYHGHGTGLAEENEYILQYFKEVDQTLWTEVLHNEHVPLLLAAVEYEIGFYKQISNYKHIADVNLTGNFEHEDRNTLYAKAKEKITPYFKEYTNAALKNFYDNSVTGLSSSIPSEVIPAAYYAQISDLFVQKDQHVWGSFNEADNVLVIHQEKRPGDECLINNAIIKTLVNGGEVHVLEKEKMPTDSPIAAFLRFSL
ncbi:hypothetical protein [Rubrolithibacter danxiaensis]|uniref:baeRF7 domain-containing protein n=1 Tax=Rubrolithibacter danxiaensis TaxID=3390805 RepID=UPI003BF8ACBF